MAKKTPAIEVEGGKKEKKSSSVTRKKSVKKSAPVVSPPVAISASQKAQSPRERKQGSGIGIIIFLALILAIIAVVYGVQNQKTDMLELEIEELKEDSKKKTSVIEEAIEKAKEIAQKAKEEAIEEARSKKFESAVSQMSFRYPEEFELEIYDISEQAIGDEAPSSSRILERALLVRRSDRINAEKNDEFVVPVVTVETFDNEEAISVGGWIIDRMKLQELYGDKLTVESMRIADQDARTFKLMKSGTLHKTFVFVKEEKTIIIKGPYEESNRSSNVLDGIVQSIQF